MRSSWSTRVALAAAVLLTAVAPAPGDAAHQPAAPPPAAAPGEPGDEVWAVRQVGDTWEVEHYTPGDGITPGALREQLAAEGVAGLVEPGRAAGACRIGTAYALQEGRCPPIRWLWAGYADPQVYFRDRTPAAWPVRQAVATWHTATGVDSYWTTGPCPKATRHCVDVRSGNFGSGWAGRTTFTMTMGRTFIDGSVAVSLNDRYAANAADRRSTTCHELGHALGVGHNRSTASCMYVADNSLDPTRPHRSDFDLLRRIVYP